MTEPQVRIETDKQYRLITRSDMDGLVCGVILKELGVINDITFAHPKDMQDGNFEIGPHDITTNLPYVDGVYICFDHHASEMERMDQRPANHIIDPEAPSAARVVYDYFGGKENPRLSGITEEMMEAVDKADAAQFSKEDILNPAGWELLSFIMDARTGLGRFHDFRISNYDLMMELIDACRNHKSIEELLSLPDVKERVDLYVEHSEKFKEQLKRCSTVHKNLIVLDLRSEDTIYAGNRFMIYALFPECNISMHVLWGKQQQNTVFAVGKSILDRSCQLHVGRLMLKYGGGGHTAAGTCQISNEEADEIMLDLISRILEGS